MARTDYENCRLCPRRCGVNRAAGQRGFCGEPAVCRIASAGAHFGEESAFSGTRGSGTIFFSGCSCQCFFCQNHQISIAHAGRDFSPEQLLQTARELIRQGVHNLNFVTPDHFWPHIAELCASLRAEGATLPFLFNSSGYQDPARINDYARWMDIFMPDFKFADAALAQDCMRDRRYPEIALAALEQMVAAKGFLYPWDPTGNRPAQTGVLVRHLVLPGHRDNSLAVIRQLHRAFGRRLPISVMSQFRPMPECRRRGQLTAVVSSADYQPVVDLVYELGFEHAFIQPDLGDARFLPDFARDEPFEGNRGR